MNPIREYDANNKLVAAGCEWGEPTDLRLALFAAAGAGTLLFVLLTMDLIKTGKPWLGAAVVAALFCLATYAAHEMRLRQRSIVFRSDGTIDAPQRLPDFVWPRYQVGGHHEAVVSIGQLVDREPDGKHNHRTALYARNGNIVRVTGEVHADVAHKVAVQLTSALQDIRDAIAEAEAASLRG